MRLVYVVVRVCVCYTHSGIFCGHLSSFIRYLFVAPSYFLFLLLFRSLVWLLPFFLSWFVRRMLRDIRWVGGYFLFLFFCFVYLILSHCILLYLYPPILSIHLSISSNISYSLSPHRVIELFLFFLPSTPPPPPP